jgi:hypothetical protein
MVDALEIIKALDRAFPDKGVRIANMSGLQLGAHEGTINQFIFDLIKTDPSGEIYYHKTAMQDKFRKREPDLVVWGWPFDDYELDDVRETLGALAEHYEANLDIERMIGGLGIRRPEGKRYYLAVTVNRIKVFVELGQEA